MRAAALSAANSSGMSGKHTGRGLGPGAALDDHAVDDDAGALDADRLCLDVDVGPAQAVATAAFYTPCLSKHRATPKRALFRRRTSPSFSSVRGSNPRPTDYESVLSLRSTS